jgi:hypothetical protein
MSGDNEEPAQTPVEDLYWRARESLEAFLLAAKVSAPDGLETLKQKHAAEILPALREYLKRTPNRNTARNIFGMELCRAAKRNQKEAFAQALEKLGRDPEMALKELKKRDDDVYCPPAAWHKRRSAEQVNAAEDVDAVKAASMETLESVEIYKRISDQLQDIASSRMYSNWTRDGRKVADADAEELYMLLRDLRPIAQRTSPLYVRLERVLGNFLGAGRTYDRREFLELCGSQDLERRVLGHGNELDGLCRILTRITEVLRADAVNCGRGTSEEGPPRPTDAVIPGKERLSRREFAACLHERLIEWLDGKAWKGRGSPPLNFTEDEIRNSLAGKGPFGLGEQVPPHDGTVTEALELLEEYGCVRKNPRKLFDGPRSEDALRLKAYSPQIVSARERLGLAKSTNQDLTPGLMAIDVDLKRAAAPIAGESTALASFVGEVVESSAIVTRTARHSADFSSVHWYGQDYVFKGLRAKCVGVLWQAWEHGTPVLHQSTILENAGSAREDQRLALVFKDHPAWGTMIVSAGRGLFRLQPPTGA